MFNLKTIEEAFEFAHEEIELTDFFYDDYNEVFKREFLNYLKIENGNDSTYIKKLLADYLSKSIDRYNDRNKDYFFYV